MNYPFLVLFLGFEDPNLHLAGHRYVWMSIKVWDIFFCKTSQKIRACLKKGSLLPFLCFVLDTCLSVNIDVYE